jgi:hypothetical protein
MLLSLQNAGGRTFEALLLAASPNRMRLAIRDFPDAVEIECACSRWQAAEGSPIQVAGIVTDARPCHPRRVTLPVSAIRAEEVPVPFRVNKELACRRFSQKPKRRGIPGLALNLQRCVKLAARLRKSSEANG